MTSAAKTITISMSDWPRSLLRSIRARAAEENVTLEQYLARALMDERVSLHDVIEHLPEEMMYSALLAAPWVLWSGARRR